MTINNNYQTIRNVESSPSPLPVRNSSKTIYTKSNLSEKNSNMKISDLFLLRSVELKKVDLINSPILTKQKKFPPSSSNQSLTNQDITTVICENICKFIGLNQFILNSKTLDDIKHPLFKSIFDKKIDIQELNTILEMTKLLPNEPSKDEFYKDICEIYLRNDDVSNAFHVIPFIKNKNISSRLLNSLFPLLSNEHEFRKALSFTNLIDDEAVRATTLSNLSIEAFDSKSLSICLYIIDCIPENESSMKKAALITLERKFLDLKENVKDKRIAPEYDRLAQQVRLKRLKEFINFKLHR